jgi:hypothetical protein
MRSIVSLFTAFAVQLHLVLGCCAHHAHSQTHANCPRNNELATKAGACGTTAHCHGHGHGEQPAAPAEPVVPAHDDCHDSHCAFRVASALKYVPDMAVASAIVIDQPPTKQSIRLQGTLPRDRGDPFELAVRPHLAHQVFLN